MKDEVDNAYVLGRPAGHHAESGEGMGFCIFNNVAVAAEYARNKYDVERILVIDWDVHHGNGTEEIFYSDSNVLFASLHQELFPFDGGNAESVGEGKGEGYNVNIPLPAGTGNEGYMHALQEIVAPIVKQFNPELILVSAGQDPNIYDPLGRMMMTSEGFEEMTKFIMDLGEKHCDGKVILCQEGGYNSSYVPFCTLKIVEALSNIKTEVEDPFLGPTLAIPKVITSNQHEAINNTKNILSKYWNI